jgi:hypothetical protein
MAGTNDDLTIDMFGDPLWLSLEQVHWLLWQRIFGNPHVAALYLTEVLATLVPSMRRSRWYFSDQELLSLEFWNEHDLEWRDGHLVVVRRPAHPLLRVDILESFAGYAWLPKLAEIWPTVFGSMLPASKEPISSPQPQAPSPNASLTDNEPLPDPKKEWLVERMVAHPPGPREGNEWARAAHLDMRERFGDQDAWTEVTLRRRMNDPDVQAEIIERTKKILIRQKSGNIRQP